MLGLDVRNCSSRIQSVFCTHLEGGTGMDEWHLISRILLLSRYPEFRLRSRDMWLNRHNLSPSSLLLWGGSFHHPIRYWIWSSLGIWLLSYRHGSWVPFSNTTGPPKWGLLFPPCWYRNSPIGHSCLQASLVHQIYHLNPFIAFLKFESELQRDNFRFCLRKHHLAVPCLIQQSIFGNSVHPLHGLCVITRDQLAVVFPYLHLRMEPFHPPLFREV